MNVAIVGLGYWGPNLVRNFSTSNEWCVTAVVDREVGRINKALAGRSGIRGYADISSVLRDDAIDAVVIATPPFTHFDLVQSALLAGKHVLVEKPLCLDSSSALALCALAEKVDRALLVDHTFLYTGAVEYLKKLITSNSLGKLHYLDSIRVNLGLFQFQANVIEDLAPHDISIFNYLLDEAPIEVSAIGSHCISQHVADVAYMTLRYKSGINAHMHLSWMSPVKVRKMMIAGDERMVLWDDVEPSEKLRIYDRGVNLENGDDRANAFVSYRMGDVVIPALDSSEALQKVAREFASVIRGAKPRFSAKDAMRVVAVMEAAHRSIAENGAFVPVFSEIPALAGK